MFVTKAALLFTSCLIFQKSVLAGCPYSQTSDGEIPNDCAHKGVRGRRLESTLPPCADIEGNWENNSETEVDCIWVIANYNCAKYGASWCPVTCNMCPESCEDVSSFEDGRGRTRDCAWVLSMDKCSRYRNKCSASCEVC